MSSSWSALHARLLSDTARTSFEARYARICATYGDSLPAGGVPGLFDLLRDAAVDPDRKAAAIRALANVAQSADDLAETATTLLVLALWPGLDAVRGRLKPLFRGRPDDLESELVGRLCVAVQTLDLARVHRIVATVLRNVERDIRRAQQRLRREAPGVDALDEVIDHVADTAVFMAREDGPQPDIRSLHRRLRPLIGDDAILVLLVVIAGYTQAEAASLIGIRPDAARKRFQRAIARLKNFPEECPIGGA